MLDSREIRKRFPGLTPPAGFVGLWEERAGILFPDTIIKSHLELALETGADLRLGCPVLGWNDEGEDVRVRTAMGDFSASSLVLATGPWIGRLTTGLDSLFTIERQVSHWFEPAPEMAQWPVTLWEHHPGGLFFTVPDQQHGFKAGIHHEGEIVDPDQVTRQTSESEEEQIRHLLARFMPTANTRLRGSSVCLYTNTPDGHFVIDRLPGSRNVIVASPCSGHGFKFSSVVGEIVAELVSQGATHLDIKAFGFSRFSAL
jgi:sarcosine oxidase